MKKIYQKIRNFFKNKWTLFTITLVIYVLWVIWLEFYLLLMGVLVIIDIFITKKVNWTFWRKKGEKPKKIVEWIESLIFAVIGASLIRTFLIEAYTIPTSSMEKTLRVGDYLFVSKYTYGPRIPMTPLSFPFVHHTMPFSENAKSFVEWIKLPYKRLKGLRKIERYDFVVFNFPEGDTVALKRQAESYYELCRRYGRKRVWNDKLNFGEIVVRPIDKKENYVKRCIGLPGDTIKIIDGIIYINNKRERFIKTLQYNYEVTTIDNPLTTHTLKNLGLSNLDIQFAFSTERVYFDSITNKYYLTYILPLDTEQVKRLKNYPSIYSVKRLIIDHYEDVFPQDSTISYNRDNMGPIWIPKKGSTIEINLKNLPIYKRVIEVYEGNKLSIKDGKIFINGIESNKYTFKMDYYFMVGDNRHNSQDSRFWGFVPEDHIVGTPIFIWLALDKDKKFPYNIRFNRIFRIIDNNW